MATNICLLNIIYSAPIHLIYVHRILHLLEQSDGVCIYRRGATHFECNSSERYKKELKEKIGVIQCHQIEAFSKCETIGARD